MKPYIVSREDALVSQLLSAIHASNSLVEDAQHILVSYLIPDGITQEVAMAKLLELLDGPGQRCCKEKVDEAIKAAMGYIREARK